MILLLIDILIVRWLLYLWKISAPNYQVSKKKQYTCLMSHKTATIASILQIWLWLDSKNLK